MRQPALISLMLAGAYFTSMPSLSASASTTTYPPPKTIQAAFAACDFSSQEVQKALKASGVKFQRGKVATQGDPFFGEYVLRPTLALGNRLQLNRIARDIQEGSDATIFYLTGNQVADWVREGAAQINAGVNMPKDARWALVRNGRETGVFYMIETLGPGTIMCFRLR